MKRVKLVFENKIRKFEVPADQCHMHVKKLIEKATANRGFIPVLQYEDDEQDWITIGTEADLALCLQTNESPKIYIFKPQDAVNSRNKKKTLAEEPNDGWVKFGFEGPESPSPEVIPSPPAEQTNEVRQSAKSANDDQPGPAPMQLEDEKEDEKADPADARAESTLPFDWNTLVEDFLTNTRPLQAMVNDVYTAVQNGGDLKTAVLRGLDKEPFKSHPFVKASMPDLDRMLGKVNHMSVLLLQVGKNGMEMAVPILARGFAKMKMGTGNQIDLSPVFSQIAPGMTKWLQSGLGNQQEATFDLGKVLRHMASRGCRPRGGEADGEPEPVPEEEDPEVAAAAKDGIVLHKGITCDVCNEKPIIGIRYKCMVCPDFDMCEECKAKGVHPAEHPLIQMNKPAPRGGFVVGKGHYKGAAEMFRGPHGKHGGGKWGKCGGKWGGHGGHHKRRAMKKLWKWNKKHCGNASEGKNDEEGSPPHHGPFGGGRHRWGGRGRHRHHPFAGPSPAWEDPASGTFAMPMEQRRPQPFFASETKSGFPTPGFDSDSSSSSSSSSDSEIEMETTHGKHKGSHPKHSRKKSKKKHKKLSKRQKKIRKRIEKLSHKQHKIHRRLAKLHHKEQKINRMLQENVMRAEQAQGPPPANQPGHDPNPNRGPTRPNYAHWPFRGGPQWGACPQFPFGPHPASAQPAPVPQNRDDYAQQLALLIEMGFDDVPTLKRLLKETKGDVKSVIAIVMSRKGFGKME